MCSFDFTALIFSKRPKKCYLVNLASGHLCKWVRPSWSGQCWGRRRGHVEQVEWGRDMVGEGHLYWERYIMRLGAVVCVAAKALSLP